LLSTVDGMQLLGLHHAAVNVTDVDAAVEFYTKTLGMTLRTDRPDLGFRGAWLDAGGQQVHLLEAPVPDNRGQHFAVRVADLDAVVVELRGAGVQVSDPARIGSARQAFVRDPSGNGVELHEVATP
jgi:catechol 2,3-dioxygenase-like lactoylglutathione lyase family enzyme